LHKDRSYGEKKVTPLTFFPFQTPVVSAWDMTPAKEWTGSEEL